MSIKRMCKVIAVAPHVIVWDVLFWMISTLYKYASYVDTVGGDKIDSFLNKGE